MTSPAYGKWETFVSVVGVITAIPVVSALVYMHFPSRKVEGLFKTLESTDATLKDNIEAGLLEDHHIRAFTDNLEILWDSTREARDMAHAARSCTEDFTNLISGLTSTIRQIERDVVALRATISTTSMRQREARANAEAAVRAGAATGIATEDSEAAVCAVRLHTRVWRSLSSTPPRFLSMISYWTSSSSESTCPPGSDGQVPNLASVNEAPPISAPGVPSSPSPTLLSSDSSPRHAEADSAADCAHPPATSPNADHLSSTRASYTCSSLRQNGQKRVKVSPASERAFARRMFGVGQKSARPSQDDDIHLIPMSGPPLVEPLYADEGDEEEEDIGSQTAQMVEY